jgi:hypothetical protein
MIAVPTTPYTGDLYGLDSHFENNTTIVEIDRLPIVNSTYTTYSEIKDVNGTVTLSTLTEDMPISTAKFGASALDYNTLSSAYSNRFMPFTFTNPSSQGRWIFIKYISGWLEPYHMINSYNGGYTSLDTFLADQVAGKTTYGILRNYQGNKLLVVNQTDITNNAISGNLIELDENGTATGTTIGTWSKITFNATPIIALNINNGVGYRQDVAFVLENGYVHEGEYHPVDDIYSYLMLNKEAKDELYSLNFSKSSHGKESCIWI